MLTYTDAKAFKSGLSRQDVSLYRASHWLRFTQAFRIIVHRNNVLPSKSWSNSEKVANS